MYLIGTPLDYYGNYSADRSQHSAAESALEAGVQTDADQFVSQAVTVPLTAAGLVCGDGAEVCVAGGYVAGSYLTAHVLPVIDSGINDAFNGIGRVTNAANNGLNSVATHVAGPAGPSILNTLFDIGG
jgi:hypothetical protein